jgi:hypothetical protein
MKSLRRKTGKKSGAPSPSCPWCGETFDVWVDEGAGAHQRYVEDCAVCCHPCVVTVEPGAEAEDDARVSVERE